MSYKVRGPGYLLQQGDALSLLRRMPDGAVDLVMGSPPYACRGDRYDGLRRKWDASEWVEWMALITAECARVSRHWVVWVVNSAVHKGRYLPACEGLIWETYKHGYAHPERPCIWHKNAVPTRCGRWFSNDWEFVVAFRCQTDAYFDPATVVTPLKYRNGGAFRQRGTDGQRKAGGAYPKGDKRTTATDVFRVTVGGGHMGSDLACENEAPYPEGLPDRFIPVLCPAGGIVLGPFGGSGTTAKVALAHGRRAVAFDVRQSQIELTARRIQTEVKLKEFAEFSVSGI